MQQRRRLALKQLSALSLAPLLPLSLGAALASTIHALPRRALVVGNSRYASAPLANPANDANAIAGALKQTGFAVDLQLDASEPPLEEAIRNFADSLGKQPAVGLFYFAGHGLQISWRNYPGAGGCGAEESRGRAAAGGGHRRPARRPDAGEEPDEHHHPRRLPRQSLQHRVCAPARA